MNISPNINAEQPNILIPLFNTLTLKCFLLLLSFLYLMFNSYKKAKVFLFLGICWFFLFSFQPFANALLKPLENTYEALLETPKVEYVLNNNTLEIDLSNKSFLIQSNIDKLESPEDLIIKI